MTVTKADCIASVKAAGMGETDARELVDMVLAERARLTSLGQVDRMEARPAEFVSKKAEQAKITAAMQQKHAALNVLRRKEEEPNIADIRDATQSEVEAFRGFLVGSHKGAAAGGRVSVSLHGGAIRRLWLGGLMQELRERPHVLKLLQGPGEVVDRIRGRYAQKISELNEFSADVVREMYEVRPGGKVGVTGNDDARFVASIFSKYTEIARLRLNDAGAMIGKLDGWTPQSHDAAKMISAGKEAWIEKVVPHLDMERSFEGASATEVREILGEVYENIVTGRGQAVSAAEKGQYLGPRNLARSMGKHRVLHFRDADAFLDYHREFGRGNVLTGVVEHLERAAYNAGRMERMGPNPESFLRALVDSRIRDIRLDSSLTPEIKAKKIRELSEAFTPDGHGVIWNDYHAMTGDVFRAVSHSGAALGRAFRVHQMLSKLGMSLMSQFTDIPIFASRARAVGGTLFGGYHRALLSFLDPYTDAERRQIANSLGVFIDGALGHLVARWVEPDSLPGWASRSVNWFFKVNGMTPWTEALRAGSSIEVSVRLASGRNLNFEQLNPDVQGLLRSHRIDEKKWEALRSVATMEADGNWHLLPENVSRIPEATFDSMLRDDLASLAGKYKDDELERRAATMRREARKRLETDLMGIYADESRYFVIEPDERTYSAIYGETRPGTWSGEIRRFVLQFKSFSVAYWQRVIQGRSYVARRDPRAGDLPGLAYFIVGLMGFGFLSVAAKDIAKGRKPRDPFAAETWAAVALQSGGLGVYGDFLFGEYNRFGNTALETAAGPFLGGVGSLVNLWLKAKDGDAKAGEFFWLMLNNTPFANLWYTRSALDYAVLYHMRELISPGTLRKVEQRIKREHKQEFILPPSRVIKRGGGFR